MGRKRKFSQEELDGMQRMRDAGKPVGDIAKAYCTTAHTVYDYTDGPVSNASIAELSAERDRVRLYVLDGIRKAWKTGRKPLKK